MTPLFAEVVIINASSACGDPGAVIAEHTWGPNATARYPARPNRTLLNATNTTVPPGGAGAPQLQQPAAVWLLTREGPMSGIFKSLPQAGVPDFGDQPRYKQNYFTCISICAAFA